MVCRKVHLDTIFAQGALLNAHDTGTVHKNVDSWHIRPGQNLGSCGTDRLLAGEINLQTAVLDVGELLLESIDAFLDLRWVTTGDDEMGGGLRGLDNS